MIEIFTDGACSGNPGKGGYGVVMRSNQHLKELSGGFRATTNNRMELLATIVGMEAINKENQEIIVVSDSEYVVNSVSKGWVFNWERKAYKDRANADLWKRFLVVYRKHQVQFKWVRGHAGHPENERCDVLAVAASRQKDLEIDEGFELGK